MRVWMGKIQVGDLNVMVAVEFLILELSQVNLQSMWAGVITVEQHLLGQSAMQVLWTLSAATILGKLSLCSFFLLRLSVVNDLKYVTD